MLSHEPQPPGYSSWVSAHVVDVAASGDVDRSAVLFGVIVVDRASRIGARVDSIGGGS